jgi:hypothetical protein
MLGPPPKPSFRQDSASSAMDGKVVLHEAMQNDRRLSLTARAVDHDPREPGNK